MVEKPSDAVSSGWDHPSETADFIVQFAAEMPRLVALCIVVQVQLEADLIEEVNRRIVEEVLPYKSPLWFHFSDTEPMPSNSNVPFIHYQEMVSPLLVQAAPNIEFFGSS